MADMILLINEDDVRDITGINENVSSRQLQSAIYEAQQSGFQRLAGTALYDRIVNLVSNKSIERPKYADYKAVLDKAQTYLAYMSVYYLVHRLHTKVGNLGINNATDDNLDTSDYAVVANYFLNRADYHAILLRNYLNESGLMECRRNAIGPEHTVASSTIFLGGKRGKTIRR